MKETAQISSDFDSRLVFRKDSKRCVSVFQYLCQLRADFNRPVAILSSRAEPPPEYSRQASPSAAGKPPRAGVPGESTAPVGCEPWPGPRKDLADRQNQRSVFAAVASF